MSHADIDVRVRALRKVLKAPNKLKWCAFIWKGHSLRAGLWA